MLRCYYFLNIPKLSNWYLNNAKDGQTPLRSEQQQTIYMLKSSDIKSTFFGFVTNNVKMIQVYYYYKLSSSGFKKVIREQLFH